jgi:hypothetical protein
LNGIENHSPGQIKINNIGGKYMKTNPPLGLMILLLGISLASCGPTPAELDAQSTQVAADIFATLTAQAPTSTPTLSPTPTVTPSPTHTLTPSPTMTATLPSVSEGWHYHSASDFHIALPERWQAVNVDEEGFDALWRMMEGVNTEWAQNITALFSSETARELIKFWAMDTEPAGFGYATVNISFQAQFYPIKVEDLCVQMPDYYEQIGIELVEADCHLEINRLDGIRLTTLISVGNIVSKGYQYIFVRGTDMWIITFALEESEWEEYEPTFVKIAESFLVDEL